MPFASEKQRRFMHARHPEIAKRWEDEAKARGTNPLRRQALKAKSSKRMKDRK